MPRMNPNSMAPVTAMPLSSNNHPVNPIQILNPTPLQNSNPQNQYVTYQQRPPIATSLLARTLSAGTQPPQSQSQTQSLSQPLSISQSQSHPQAPNPNGPLPPMYSTLNQPQPQRREGRTVPTSSDIFDKRRIDTPSNGNANNRASAGSSVDGPGSLGAWARQHDLWTPSNGLGLTHTSLPSSKDTTPPFGQSPGAQPAEKPIPPTQAQSRFPGLAEYLNAPRIPGHPFERMMSGGSGSGSSSGIGGGGPASSGKVMLSPPKPSGGMGVFGGSQARDLVYLADAGWA
jgi:hypothetical protein